jgi:hypothetical protein
MLTAIIRSNGTCEPLAATLTVLIAAVSEGFVGHAVVVAPAQNSEIDMLVDATGASFVVAPAGAAWIEGARAARGDWLLLLDAGDLPDLNWTRSVERHLLVASQRPALMPKAEFMAGLKERALRLLRPRALGAGLVTTRREAEAGLLSAAPLRLRVTRQGMLG